VTLLHCEESWHDWEHAATLSLTPDPLLTYPPFDASHALASIVTVLPVVVVVGFGVVVVVVGFGVVVVVVGFGVVVVVVGFGVVVVVVGFGVVVVVVGSGVVVAGSGVVSTSECFL